MASSSFYILDVVSYQDLSRPSASLAHCCIHDNLYFLAYFAFLNHKCKTKATKTNQVEKKLLKKAVSTALWIHMILFACYLPFFFVFVFFVFLVFFVFCFCFCFLFHDMTGFNARSNSLSGNHTYAPKPLTNPNFLTTLLYPSPVPARHSHPTQ